MKISDEHMKEFREIYRNHFGIDIEAEAASTQAIRLVQILLAFSKAHNTRIRNKKHE